jgi:hypothetical protein
VGDGREALDVSAEDLADGLGLGLAQLGELVQCCWLSCSAPARPSTPMTGSVRTAAAYPSLESTRANASAGVSSGWAAVTVS